MGDLIQIIGAIVAFVLAGSVWGTLKYNKGKKDNQANQKEIDHENATDIRDRVDAVEPVRDGDIIYRD